MELTGKAKKDFEKWYKNIILQNKVDWKMIGFYTLKDWFIEVGITINCLPSFAARSEAIKRANEIYNQR